MTEDIRGLTAALAADPASLVFLRLGEALRRRGQLDAAQKVALAGLNRYPHLPDAHDLYARVLADRQDFANAFDEWDMALRLDPNHLGSLKGIGFLYFQAGDAEHAREHLRAAAAIVPDDEGVLSALALVERGPAMRAPGRPEARSTVSPPTPGPSATPVLSFAPAEDDAHEQGPTAGTESAMNALVTVDGRCHRRGRDFRTSNWAASRRQAGAGRATGARVADAPGPRPGSGAQLGLAATWPSLLVLPVAGSTSKAQNVNTALAEVTGRIVGLFDADHHPDPGCFERAWLWLSNGYGVVQGHCVVRNGDASWVTRMVAVEFESIYAVSHPGRSELHGNGIFGGSNGYWQSDLLRTVRLRGSMLTEDIDASMRVTLRGMKIASDPGLLSRELAPTRLRSLAGQRLRWAQGWTQVSLEYLGTALRSRRVTRRQKAGLLFMLGWRELYPWVSLQIVPLLAYALTHPREVAISWTIPIFVLSSLFALSGSPIQTILAYRLAAPNVRRHRNWFLAYPLWSLLFYEEFKNTITRVAHLKQVMGERRWLVTARSEEPLANKDTDEGVGVAPAETCPAPT